ncbi:hypothetical protein GCM10023191_102410 [Actinoallomurus oryzae]|uniref:Uncharacterized protein n=1 Tax=Actinoallomurus oryzae TaxID=502180 RepID=A0ABP8R9Z0_9ACTN
MTVRDETARTVPHSAVTPDSGPAEGVNAGARGRAREATPGSAQCGAQSTAQSAAQSEADSSTLGKHLAKVWTRFLGWITPPDIWSSDRPSLAKVWAHATHGQWARPTGPARRAGQIYTVLVAFPIAACCKYIEWLSERASRLVAAGVLLVVLAQFPPISWLI